MGRLLDSPWPIVVIAIVTLLLFAAPKLPAMARSLAQSARIIRSEAKEAKDDGKSGPPDVPDATSVAEPGNPQPQTGAGHPPENGNASPPLGARVSSRPGS
ncbi:Sec-independent protein translocase TatA [Arthrobacter sp. 24S4-2]|nr:twin-arginine translocase TatA/TatE family subunit [Arthrobacter sp. 24S4-2]QCO98061.1 Sec-independent protein translocase TatA [Arthrobacter sp. 24S4-2]